MSRYCSIEEACDLLDMDYEEIMFLIDAGEVSCIKTANKVMLFYSEIEDLKYMREYEPWNAKYNIKRW